MLAFLLALALAHAPLPASSPAPDWSSWPALGTVTTPFGSGHPGIDIGILRSLTVRAAQPGVVVRVGQPRGYEGYGNIVEVSDGRGFTTLYAHLAGWRVRVGERVWPGQVIGTAGCTGWCTGTHLHFEMRLRGRAVDPLRFRRGREVTPGRWLAVRRPGA